ncbi:MAG: low molecular weight phosphotyrosine protein phosphatase [Saprospiraceae bacterium]|nr:low molecular weight phosphotyrosine protein phosphatase [Saprospiraceae bacterium]
MKILMVCLGNICRSPLAEGILKEKIKIQGLDWEVDSAGTGSWHVGEKPDRRSIAIARQHHINLTDQRARQLKATDLDSFDLIIGMDRSNRNNIIKLSTNAQQEKKIHLIMDFIYPNQEIEVPDPYYDRDGFEEVYEMIDKATDAMIEKLGRD